MRIGRGAPAFRAQVCNDVGVWTTGDAVFYDQFYPYYAEIYALSEIRKKPGSDVEFRSGVGGHSLLYLSGVRRDRRAAYPTLKLCEPETNAADFGVGISVNSHYRNANWVAADGRDFVFRGMLNPGERLTRAAYDRTQAFAKQSGILDGVEFHERFFRGKPCGMSRRDYMYEISVATDYAVTFGRNTYGARVPLDRARMSVIVDFLNKANAPYRAGTKEFRWQIFNDNCSHLAHNALAAAGVWKPWPTGQLSVLAAFNFPVPKNEFVDLVLRTNDMPIDDPAALYGDDAARRAHHDSDNHPTAPGALVSARAALRDNDIYETDGLRLIFYDNPFWGPYRFHFMRIFSEPRYWDLEANLRHFQSLYETTYQSRRAAGAQSVERTGRGTRDEAFAHFRARYDGVMTREAMNVRNRLAVLRHPAREAAEALL
jgi:hypothetical protein